MGGEGGEAVLGGIIAKNQVFIPVHQGTHGDVAERSKALWYVKLHHNTRLLNTFLHSSSSQLRPQSCKLHPPHHWTLPSTFLPILYLLLLHYSGREFESRRLHPLFFCLLTATSERKNTDPGNVKCKDPACEEEILKCNMVDKILYEHYKEKLGEITRGIEGFEEKLEMLKGVMEKSTGNKQKYPVSCRGQVKNEFDQMHSCKGNLTP